jgi:sialate O-acetylesterase
LDKKWDQKIVIHLGSKSLAMRKLSLLSLVLALALCCNANVRLPNVLSDNMVLQQQSQVKLWGWCEAGERIAVVCSWDQRTDSVRGTRDGNWKIVLSTPSAGGPYTISIKGQNSIVLNNILIGEVWVCSGQSNMEMCETWGLPDVKEELPVCYNSNIRFFHVPRTTSAAPQDNCPGNWTNCDSVTLKQFSAVAYFFGKKLNKALNVPIGLIEAAWGGTNAEDWTPASLIEGDEQLKTAEAKVQPADGWPYKSGSCYNGMIAPIVNFSVAGAIWYQGESNVVAPFTYERLLTTMIASWRQAWALPLPFYLVQIAPFGYGVKYQGSAVREQEAAVTRVQNTGMVVISDLVTDTLDIHPKNKHDVGLRLADWALADTYHQQGITYKNPAFQHMEIKGDKVVITCSDAPTGLILKGKAVEELLIAGDDELFWPAQAHIEGNKLIVSAAAVKKPVAVRYQFDNAGAGNIFGKEGLPLAPFRTDDWSLGIQ